MAKRFTDTDKYKKQFFRGLPGPYKLLWDYLYHDCNHAGIWHKDFQVAQIYLGSDMPVNEEKALSLFNQGEERIKILDGGTKWLVVPFAPFQYGDLNPQNRLHSSVLGILGKYEKKVLTSPSIGAKDKDKDMDKDKVKDVKQQDGPSPENLIELWNTKAHPNLPKVEMLTEKRRVHIKARLVEHPKKDFWERLIERVNSIPLLRGENERNWKCTFDWILNVNNMAKILEGNYDPIKRTH